MKGSTLKLQQAEQVAREAVSTYLASRAPLPSAIKDRLVLGKGSDGSCWLFELYVPGVRPEEAVVLVQARVDKQRGEVSVTSPINDRWDSISTP